MSANRNKRSIAVDFASLKGQKIIQQMAQTADVVIENFKVGGLTKYGLDYKSLCAVKKDVIYCSITGFGQTGPRAQQPGYDFVLQGMGGLMSITGEKNTGQQKHSPQKVGVAVVDVMTGVYAATAILAAIVSRDRTGAGQHIDMSLLDVQASFLANQASNYLIGDMIPTQLGNEHPNIAPYETFMASDGYLIVTVGNEKQFSAVCNTLGVPEVAVDPRYLTNPLRVANRRVLHDTLDKAFNTKSKAHWITTLTARGVPVSPVNNIKEVFEEPQIIHRKLVATVPHPRNKAGVKVMRTPIQSSVMNRDALPSCPPMLGQHTREVLSELGYSATEIGELESSGVVKTTLCEV